MNQKNRKFLQRLVGNLGVSFFSPLLGISVADDLFNHGISFIESLIISGVTSGLTVGLMLSREVLIRGESKGTV